MEERLPDACALAHHLLQDLFGSAVADVCQKLLQKGPMTLTELTRANVIPPPILRSSLLVLIQHNCVECHLESARRSHRAGHYLYRAHLENALLFLRKPWFLVHIRETCDEMSENLVEALLENGRMRLDQMFARAAVKRGREASSVENEATAAFVGLVQSKYIERCRPCSLPPPLHPTLSQSTKRPNNRDREKSNKERELKEVYASYTQSRFKLPMSLLLDAAFAEGTGRKRRHEEMEGGEDAILWRVNTEEFNRCFRHKACIDFVASKIGRDAGLALKCMLDVTRPCEAKMYEDISRPVSLDEILKAFDVCASRMEAEAPEDLDAALKALKEDQLELVTYMGEQANGSVFCVNLSRIVECRRLLLVETVIRDRFGLHALRIFRLLLLKGQLEQKQIADLSMLDLKETRTAVYSMMRAGYVQMQDIPQTADHAASRTFFTWRVRLKDATAQLRKDLYKAAFNTHCRLMHELRKGNEVSPRNDTTPQFVPVAVAHGVAGSVAVARRASAHYREAAPSGRTTQSCRTSPRAEFVRNRQQFGRNARLKLYGTMSTCVPYAEHCLRLRVAAQILRLPSDCVSAALTLYHRYKRANPRDPHEQRVLTACLFCATKLEETECRTTDLLNVVDAVFHPSPSVLCICPGLTPHPGTQRDRICVTTGDAYYAEKEILVSAEHRLLRAIHFDVVVPHPQRELLLVCVERRVPSAATTVATRLMNDAVAYTDFTLSYESGAIAASVLHVALLITATELETGRGRQWYEELGYEREVVETLGHRLLDLLNELQMRGTRSARKS